MIVTGYDLGMDTAGALEVHKSACVLGYSTSKGYRSDSMALGTAGLTAGLSVQSFK